MKKILTIIFDGFGIRDEENGNAIKAATMNNFNELWKTYPHALLEASGSAVGLNDGQEGNSEVGHMTIGAGRILKQPEILINEFLANPDIENKNVQKLLSLKDKDIHIMGLCSDGNIHAGVDDFLEMYKFLVNNGFTKIHFHIITDGRDTDVHASYKYIKMIKDLILENNEFIKPIKLSNDVIKNGDVLIWMNYRADRAKQILNSIVNCSNFDSFAAKDLSAVTVFSFLPVDKKIKTLNFIEHPDVTHPLGIYLSELGFTQARIAESEKYPHVTYFFDGGFDGKIENCDKFHVASPDVATYDLKPEMSCVEVTKKVVGAMNADYDFILVNFANPDMVGHTGNMDAATKACMAIDLCLGKILEKAEDNFYKVILLADHGNADIMINSDGSPCTTHTTSKVPFIIVDNKIKMKETGTLVNVAPTILDYMDIAIPSEMAETVSLLIEE